MESPQQGASLSAALCLLIGALVVLQLWLLAASLDALYSGETDVLLPAAGVSLALFLCNGILVRTLLSFDERMRRMRAGG
jgi:hypothetical protein